jgi:tRNA threonylcarbamoyladenosine biosynthesis protein TsaE
MEKPSSMNSINGNLQRRLNGLADTARLACQVAPLLDRGDAILLTGPLGAGKSTFARALIRALTQADEEVPSPTFTLVQTYVTKTGLELSHFDLYRLTDPEEVLELGFDEALDSGAVLVEWPQRLGTALPTDRLDIELSMIGTASVAAADDEPRLAALSAHGTWVSRLRALEDDEMGGSSERN